MPREVTHTHTHVDRSNSGGERRDTLRYVAPAEHVQFDEWRSTAVDKHLTDRLRYTEIEPQALLWRK